MRYYFDAANTLEFRPDEIGIEFDDDDTALAEALRSMGEWVKELVKEPSSRAMMVIVRDEHREIARLTVRLNIDISRSPAGTV